MNDGTGPRPAPTDDSWIKWDLDRMKAGALLRKPVYGLCPAGCGCIWRDNFDGSMSLGVGQRSCTVCEYKAFNQLIPLYANEQQLKLERKPFNHETQNQINAVKLIDLAQKNGGQLPNIVCQNPNHICSHLPTPCGKSCAAAGSGVPIVARVELPTSDPIPGYGAELGPVEGRTFSAEEKKQIMAIRVKSLKDAGQSTEVVCRNLDGKCWEVLSDCYGRCGTSESDILPRPELEPRR